MGDFIECPICCNECPAHDISKCALCTDVVICHSCANRWSDTHGISFSICHVCKRHTMTNIPRRNIFHIVKTVARNLLTAEYAIQMVLMPIVATIRVQQYLKRQISTSWPAYAQFIVNSVVDAYAFAIVRYCTRKYYAIISIAFTAYVLEPLLDVITPMVNGAYGIIGLDFIFGQ